MFENLKGELQNSRLRLYYKYKHIFGGKALVEQIFSAQISQVKTKQLIAIML